MRREQMNRQFTARPAEPDTKGALPQIHWERGDEVCIADEHRAGRVREVHPPNKDGVIYVVVEWNDGLGRCCWPSTAFRKPGEETRPLSPQKPSDEVRKPQRWHRREVS